MKTLEGIITMITFDMVSDTLWWLIHAVYCSSCNTLMALEAHPIRKLEQI